MQRRSTDVFGDGPDDISIFLGEATDVDPEGVAPHVDINLLIQTMSRMVGSDIVREGWISLSSADFPDVLANALQNVLKAKPTYRWFFISAFCVEIADRAFRSSMRTATWSGLRSRSSTL